MDTEEVRLYFAYMSHLFFYAISFLIFVSFDLSAQKIWSGLAGDDQWSNALNWAGNTVPEPDDEIILDNSFVQHSYIVQLPGAAAAVTVRSIHIFPGADYTIELILPVSSTRIPALVVTGPGYGLDISRGGIFRNASGASSGTPASIADSIRIRNGGRFIHNTPRAHAANVQVLSAAPGTELGIMEFDVPDVSSTISLSGRIYGKLLLRSAAAGGALKYTAAGTSPVRIRNDLDIGQGVSCGLNFSDTIILGGDLINSGHFDLGNTARKVVLAIAGNILQTDAGLLTESGEANPEILLTGNALHNLTIKGSIENQVALVIHGTGDALLSAPLRLNYKLSLIQGRLFSSSAALLTLGQSCTSEADTLSGTSFISGPVRKTGLNNEDFVFPLGKGVNMRWMKIKNATGDFTAEYNSIDPSTLSNTIGAGLHHISHMEYWTLSAEGAGDATAILSFRDPNSGGVTRLADLRVARLTNGKWENAGNAAFAGSAGADGWVSSTAASGFSAGVYSLALASATGQENPLPLSFITLKMNRKENILHFNWTVFSDNEQSAAELQESSDNRIFRTIVTRLSLPEKNNYDCSIITGDPVPRWFRVRSTDSFGKITCYSNVLFFKENKTLTYFRLTSSVVQDYLPVIVFSEMEKPFPFQIYNAVGELVSKGIINVGGGRTDISVNICQLTRGWYYLGGTLSGQGLTTLRFFKR